MNGQNFSSAVKSKGANSHQGGRGRLNYSKGPGLSNNEGYFRREVRGGHYTRA